METEEGILFPQFRNQKQYCAAVCLCAPGIEFIRMVRNAEFFFSFKKECYLGSTE